MKTRPRQLSDKNYSHMSRVSSFFRFTETGVACSTVDKSSDEARTSAPEVVAVATLALAVVGVGLIGLAAGALPTPAST